MHKPDGRKREAEDIDGRFIENVRDQTGPGRFRFVIIEDVLEAAAYIVNGFRRSVNGNYATLFEIKGADIIEAHDVIGMRVSEEDRIDAVYLGAQCLLAEIRGRIDEDTAVLKLDIDGWPQSFIAGIIGAADRAMTPDGGNAYAGARTEHRDTERIDGHLRTGLSF
jgi:hypothetical protein